MTSSTELRPKYKAPRAVVFEPRLASSAVWGAKIFIDREGRVEHVGSGDMSLGREYIANWFAETLGGRTAP